MLGACSLETHWCLASLVYQHWLRPQFHLCFGLVEAVSASPPIPCQHNVVIQKQDLAERIIVLGTQGCGSAGSFPWFDLQLHGHLCWPSAEE